MLIKTIILIFCILTLSGCMISFDAQELLTPPRLTAEQAEIYDALAMTIGPETFKFKYPRSGDYLSACILRDLDNDGRKEAIAFYEITGTGGTSTWMGLLEQTEDGGWRSVKEMPAPGNDIDMIAFAPITSEDSDNIIVGWSNAGEANNNCVIYSYEDKNLKEAHDYEFLYSEMLIENLDDNELYELILCTKQSNTKAPKMRLVKFRSGKIVTTSEVDMPEGMTEYVQLVYGPLAENTFAIFADVLIGQDEMTTKIAVVGDSLIEELTEEALGVYETFERPALSFTCQDINQDGLIDIPTNILLPGYSGMDEGEQIERTQYNSLKDGTLVAVANLILNERGEYQLRLPESWVDTVTVKVQPDTGEWRFVVYAGSLEDSVTELLRIKVISPSDYQDKLETVEYREIGTKGASEYHVYIPNNDYPLSITYEDLEEMLTII